MPPSPLLASSLVAHEMPAAPRSWMPSTRSPANSSRQHSMSTFSANGSPTCTAGRLVGAALREGVGGEDAGPADAVAAGACAEEHDLVADAAGVGQVQVLVAQHSDGERVHERVGLIHRVEPGLAADVRQAEAVGVEADAADDPGHDAGGVGVVDRAEAQGVHDGDRASAHRDDVAHDAADTGRRALERLDVARVVVALDLEGDRPALADVDDAGVLAHADHEVLGHLGADLLPELAQPHLARLVGAVLAPHHGVHRELAAAWGAGRGCSRMRSYSSVLSPSAAYGCSFSGVAVAF